ncbi:MAG TPA: hypothetical protein VEY93_10305 [Longimicrobium sp.]|nr:hypothetical protein [Longimicrobium sp.]
MHKRSGVRSLLLAAAVGSLAACAPSTAGTRHVSAQDACPGAASLVVNNSTGDQVEIMHTRSTGGRGMLTVVGPGRHEIDISGQPGAVYFAQRLGSRSILAMSTRPQSRDRGVSLERVCRASS